MPQAQGQALPQHLARQHLQRKLQQASMSLSLPQHCRYDWQMVAS